MSFLKIIKFPVLSISFICLLIALCFPSVRSGLSTDSFLMDEALQFYTAIGDHHFELGHRHLAPLSKVIFHNFNDNLDPGGFTLLLNIWSRLSEDTSWLRLLPFSFFIGALAIVFFIFSRAERSSWAPSFLICAFIASYSPLMNWAFILRAYSLEILGLSYLCFLLCSERRKHHYLFYLPLIFFAFSRYSFLVFLGVFLLMEIYRQGVLKKSQLLILASAGALLSLPFAIFIAPKISAKLPLYIQNFTLLYNLRPEGDLLSLFYRNLSSLTYTLLLVLLVLYFIDRSFLSARTRRLFHFTLCMHSIFIYLSAMGLYPWVMQERFGLSLSYLTFLCTGMFAMDVGRLSEKIKRILRSKLLVVLLIIPALQIREFRFDSYSAMAPSIDLVPLEQLDNGSVYLGHNAFFEAYFLFDLGRFKSKRELFERFDFDRPRGSLKPSLEYKYLIISQLDRENKNFIENELNLRPINSDRRTFVYKVGN